jgi:hypothetical protein
MIFVSIFSYHFCNCKTYKKVEPKFSKGSVPVPTLNHKVPEPEPVGTLI